MMGEGGRDEGVKVKYLLVITDRLRGGGGGGKKPHLGSLRDCVGISSGTAAPCRRVFCMFAQQLLVLFRAFPSCSLFNMAEECQTCWAQVQFLKL